MAVIPALLASSSAIAQVAGSTSPAAAPASPGTEAADALPPGTIVVTANRRAQSIQNVPMSITAVTAATLQNTAANTFFDYATRVPNLSFASTSWGPSQSRSVAIRGIADAGTTGFYIDDTPVPDSLDPKMMNVSRIEVLRGPQGTLYGGRSEGGTVRLITEQPSLTEVTGQAHASLSTTAHTQRPNYQFDGSVSFPIVTDKVALMVAGVRDSEAGYFNRVIGPLDEAPAKVVKGVGNNVTNGLSATLLVKPTDRLTITPRIMYQRTTANGFPLFFAPVNNDGGTTVLKFSNFDQRQRYDIGEYSLDRWILGSLTVGYDVGFGTFTSATSYFDRKNADTEDGTEGLSALYDSPDFANSGTVTRHRRSFTQELRFTSKFGGPLQLTAGGYYTRTKTFFAYPEWSDPGLNAFLTERDGTDYGSDDVYVGYNRQFDQELAAYGEATLKLTNRFSVIGGARVFRVRGGSYGSEWNGILNGGLSTTGRQIYSENGVVPKASLQYHVNRNTQIFFTAAKGFRPGGVNNALPSVCDAEAASLGIDPNGGSYDADTVWSYELGEKASFLHNRVTVNASIFRIDWSKIQQTVFLSKCGFNVTANAGQARSQGFELEASVRPTDRLTLGWAFGLIDATFQADAPGTVFHKGDRIPEVPKYTTSVDADYRFPIGDDRKGFLHANYKYVSNSTSAINAATDSAGNLVPRIRPSYSIIDLRGGVDIGKYELALFLKNATNEHASLGDPVDVLIADPTRARVSVNQPRTFGVEGRFHF